MNNIAVVVIKIVEKEFQKINLDSFVACLLQE
jgi:hypothetical protein